MTMIFYWITVFSAVAAATDSAWIGDYVPVEGLCQQATCCCVTGVLTISQSGEAQDNLQVDAPLSGDVPCHSEEDLSSTFLILNDKVAVGHDWDPLIMTMLESGEILDLTDLTKRDPSAPTHNCHNFLRKTNSSTRAAWGPWSDCSSTCGLGLRHRVCTSGNCIGASTERCIMPPCQAVAATDSAWIGDYEPVEGLCQQAKCCCVTGVLTISQSEAQGDLQVDAPLSGDVPCHSEEQLSSTFMIVNDEVAIGHDWDPLVMTMMESGEIMDLVDLTKRDASAPTHNCHNFFRKTNSAPTRAVWGPWSDCSSTCGVGMRHRICMSGNCIGASTERCTMPPCPAVAVLDSDWIGDYEPVKGLCQQATCCCVTGLLTISQSHGDSRDQNLQVDAPLSGDLPCHSEEQLSTTFMIVNDEVAVGHDWDPLIMTMLESGEILDLTDLTQIDSISHNCHNFFKKTNSSRAAWGPWSDCSATCGVGMRHRVCNSGNCVGASTEKCTMPPCQDADVNIGNKWIGKFAPVDETLCKWEDCCCITGVLTSRRDIERGQENVYLKIDAPLSGGVTCSNEAQLETTFMIVNNTVALGHDWDPLLLAMLDDGEIMEITDFTQKPASPNCHQFLKKTHHRGD